MKIDQISHLISRIYATEDVELGCDEVQSLLPSFVEAEVSGWESDPAGSSIWLHLANCSDCEAVYQGLKHVLEVELAEGALPEADESLAAWKRPEELVARSSSA